MTVIDLDRHVYGDRSAPVTIREYGDFQCPYCRDAAPVLANVVEESEGMARLVFRHFPLFTVHPYALTAALAAEAAGPLFWPMHTLLFSHQDHLSDLDLARYATQVGADDVVGAGAQRFRPAVVADYDTGVSEGVRGTPTLYVDNSIHTGRITRRALSGAVERAVAGRSTQSPAASRRRRGAQGVHRSR